MTSYTWPNLKIADFQWAKFRQMSDVCLKSRKWHIHPPHTHTHTVKFQDHTIIFFSKFHVPLPPSPTLLYPWVRQYPDFFFVKMTTKDVFNKLPKLLKSPFCMGACVCVWGGGGGGCVCNPIFRGPWYDSTPTHRGLYIFRGPIHAYSKNIG